MNRPCNKYFTINHKLKRFLYITLSAFKVPQDLQDEIVNKILSMDIVSIAKKVMKELFRFLAVEFKFDLTSTQI